MVRELGPDPLVSCVSQVAPPFSAVRPHSRLPMPALYFPRKTKRRFLATTHKECLSSLQPAGQAASVT